MGQLKAFDADTNQEVPVPTTGKAYYEEKLKNAITCVFGKRIVQLDQPVPNPKRKGKMKTKEAIFDVALSLEPVPNTNQFKVKSVVEGKYQDSLISLFSDILNQVDAEIETVYCAWFEGQEHAQDQEGKMILNNLTMANATDYNNWNYKKKNSLFEQKLIELGLIKSGKDYSPLSHKQKSEQSNYEAIVLNDDPPTATLFIDADNPEVQFERKDGKYERKTVPPEQVCFYYADKKEGLLKSFCVEVPNVSSGGGGGGAARADNVAEVEYAWTGNGPLGEALGLAPEFFFGMTGGKGTPSVDQSQLDSYLNDKQKKYFITNVPWAKASVAPSSSVKPQVQTPTKTCMGSEILYLKRFKTNEELLKGKVKKKNDPASPAAPRIPRMMDADVNYKCFENIDADVLYRKKQKGKVTGTDKPTGLRLQHGQTRERSSAGTVMAYAMIENGSVFAKKFNDWLSRQKGATSASPLSATDLTNFVIQTDEWSATEWKDDFADVRSAPVVETLQEWCHLYGHGDGGKEELKNFVSGSKHCNTEQLAIETGQRKGKIQNLSARVTAYLYRNYGSVFQSFIEAREVAGVFTSDVMADQEDFFEKIENTTKLRFKDDFPQNLSLASSIVSGKLSVYRSLYPLARWLRYKIYHRSDTDQLPSKIFDHIYDAQSQSFDNHEFKILKTTVERVIAEATGNLASYQMEINELLKKLSKPMTYSYDARIAQAISECMQARTRISSANKRSAQNRDQKNPKTDPKKAKTG